MAEHQSTPKPPSWTIPNFNKEPIEALREHCDSIPLNSTGTKADLACRLHDHYRERADFKFNHILENPNLYMGGDEDMGVQKTKILEGIGSGEKQKEDAREVGEQQKRMIRDMYMIAIENSAGEGSLAGAMERIGKMEELFNSMGAVIPNSGVDGEGLETMGDHKKGYGKDGGVEEVEWSWGPDDQKEPGPGTTKEEWPHFWAKTPEYQPNLGDGYQQELVSPAAGLLGPGDGPHMQEVEDTAYEDIEPLTPPAQVEQSTKKVESEGEAEFVPMKKPRGTRGQAVRKGKGGVTKKAKRGGKKGGKRR